MIDISIIHIYIYIIVTHRASMSGTRKKYNLRKTTTHKKNKSPNIEVKYSPKNNNPMNTIHCKRNVKIIYTQELDVANTSKSTESIKVIPDKRNIKVIYTQEPDDVKNTAKSTDNDIDMHQVINGILRLATCN